MAKGSTLYYLRCVHDESVTRSVEALGVEEGRSVECNIGLATRRITAVTGCATLQRYESPRIPICRLTSTCAILATIALFVCFLCHLPFRSQYPTAPSLLASISSNQQHSELLLLTGSRSLVTCCHRHSLQVNK